MMVRRAWMLTAILVVVLVVGLLVAGCGGNEQAKKVFDQALKNLGALKSFKASITTTTTTASSTPGSSSPSSVSKANVEVTNEGEPKMHTTMDMSGAKIEGYQIGDTSYIYEASQGWTKQQASQSKAFNVQIADSLKTGVKDVKIVSQDDKNYLLSFKWSQPASSTSGSSASSKEANPVEVFTMKVDKPTMNITEMSVKGSSGTQTQSETIKFSDFNTPITITLPEDAKNAKSAESTPGSSSP